MISRRHVLPALGAASVLFHPGKAPAAAPPARALSDEDRTLVARAADYLDALTTATARFIQTAADGRQSGGELWLQRPGRARFDYDPPSGLKIAADGSVVTIVDERLKTIHSYPLSTTPLSLVLARHVALGQGSRVDAVTRREGGIDIQLRGGHGAARGVIILSFRDSPLGLSGWTVTDARGSSVHVQLMGLERSAPRPNAFFILREPGPLPSSQ